MIRSRGIGAALALLVCAAAVGAQAMQSDRFVMIAEADKPGQKCRVLKCWRDKDNNKVCQVQAIDSGEVMTIVEPDSRPGKTPTKVVHWGGQKSAPAMAPVAPADALVVGEVRPPAKPSVWDRAFASSRPRVTTQARVTPVPVTDPDKPAVLSARLGQAKAKGRPRDPNDAWGSVERWSDDDAAKAAEQAVARANAVAPAEKKPAVVVAAPPPPAPKAFVKAAVAPKPKAEPPSWLGGMLESKPKAEVKATLPSWGKVEAWSDRESKKAADAAASRAQLVQPAPKKPALVVDTPDVKAPVALETPPAPRPVPAPVRSDVSTWARLTGVRRPADAVVAAPPKADGAAWAKATGLPQTKPAEKPAAPKAAVAAAPAPSRPMGQMPYPTVSVSAGNAFTERSAAGPMMMPQVPQQMPTQMVMADGVPAGLNNAFTAGGSSRPMPPDMGRAYYVPNGLQGGGQMGGAETRPVFGAPPQGYYAAGYYAPQGYPAGGYYVASGYYYPVPTQPLATPPQTPASVVQASMVTEDPSSAAARTLADSLLPSEREMAAELLAKCDWRRQPEAADALAKAARTDLAATVRAACVRGLARMKCNTVPVVSAVQALKADPDFRVRQAAEQALAVLAK